MRILVTGSEGFIGKNLILFLKELNHEVLSFNRKNKISELHNIIDNTDFIIHLAAANRPKNESDFTKSNPELTLLICEILRSKNKKIPIIFTSSIHAEVDNPYGRSKLESEKILENFSKNNNSEVHIYRLSGVFGKWCKPNYNSVVATFCNNISKGIQIEIKDPNIEVRLVYIDDVIGDFIKVIEGERTKKYLGIKYIYPEYKISLGDLASQLIRFKESRDNLVTERVGGGLVGKLYSTYISYLTPDLFSYSFKSSTDHRGVFAEIIKTKDSGQMSFLSVNPGEARGNHYHHSKTEKFIIIQGEAKFDFRHVNTNEQFVMEVNADELKVIETVPGWVHKISNNGDKELLALLWSNEIFDINRPDTISQELSI